MNMIKRPLVIAAAGAAIALAGTAQAKHSTDAEFRGYQTCIKAEQKESRGLVSERDYLVAAQGSNTAYYVNATRWNDGDREAIRINCETTNRGTALVSKTTLPGRYDTQGSRVTVEVAQQ